MFQFAFQPGRGKIIQWNHWEITDRMDTLGNNNVSALNTRK